MAEGPENGHTPEITVKYQVIVNIDSLDRLQIVAPSLPLDRVDVILARAANWTQLELSALRTAEVIEARRRAIRIADGPMPPLPPLTGLRG